ncbi:hypothetical protein F5B20DRAFT_597472 [Whalleya microplaca]|nr:hypothetical protein F5B20DRAFT_597472 [Whalleya microplaca]
MAIPGFPAEITDRVIWHLAGCPERGSLKRPENLANYASINRAWQSAIEPWTFRNIVLIPSNLSEARRILTPARQSYIRVVTAELVYEIMDPKERGHYGFFEFSIYADSFVSLFHLIKSWDNQFKGGPKIWLRFRTTSPYGWYLYPSPKRTRPHDYSSRSSDSWFYNQDLPSIYSVSRLTVGGNNGFAPNVSLSHTALKRIVAACPRLEKFEFGPPEIDWGAEVAKSAAAIVSVLPKSTRSLSLSVPMHPLREIREGYPQNGENYNKLNRSIQNATQLRDIALLTRISPDLFWPTEINSESDEPCWANLETLAIQFGQHSPCGTSLWEVPRTRNNGHQQFIEDRSYNEEAMNSIYTQAARAIARMPRLRQLTMENSRDDKPYHQFRFEVSYRRAVASWRSRPIFRPSETVLSLLREAANLKEVELRVDVQEIDEDSEEKALLEIRVDNIEIWESD